MKISVPMLSLGGNQKPPDKKMMRKDMDESAVHDEARQSMRDWVAGRKSNGEHKKVMDRAQKALGMNKVEYRK